jgi:uncharacterized protein (TIGR02145 family)
VILRFFFVLPFLLLACTQVERDNIYDPGGINYYCRECYYSSSSSSSSSSFNYSSNYSSSNNISYCSGIEYNTLTEFCLDGIVKYKEAIIDSRDGKAYKITVIGSQIWMAENLRYETSNTKCFDNDPNNCDIYGILYDWNTAKIICPSGWHLPSDAEWIALAWFAGSNAGTELKANTGHWISNKGTDNFGFTALPGGFYYDRFRQKGEVAGFWSATAGSQSGSAHFRYFTNINSSLNLAGHYTNRAWSYVRCLKD